MLVEITPEITPKVEPDEVMPEIEPVAAPEAVEGLEIEPEATPGRRREGRSRADVGRGSAWSRFPAGRDPNPVEVPAVIMLGVRPHEPAREFAGNPACVICGGIRTELPDGYYCAGCEKMCLADEAQIRMAKHATPSPSPEKRVPDRPRDRPDPSPGRRRRKAKARKVPYDPSQLKGGLG